MALSCIVTVTLSDTVSVPSDSARVNSTGVSSETLGAVKDGSSMSPVNVMESVELCDQAYVRVSSVSRSVTVASRVTTEPSAASWSAPASTVGGALALSCIVTVTLSDTVSVPSDSARVNSTGVSSETLGAVKDGSSMSPVNVMESVELCDQAYVRVSSVSRSVTVASRVTTEPSAASWSAPASTVGGALALSRICDLVDTSVPSTVPG